MGRGPSPPPTCPPISATSPTTRPITPCARPSPEHPESAEARLKASIPTTARVETGSITPTVAYAGDAQFAPIETTDLSYATNTTDTVIKSESAISCFRTASGSWPTIRMVHGNSPARCRTRSIEIPPSSPVYNATYVRVYDTEPDAVWYGYTMGYLYGFLAWGTYVYGTGWSYPPYWYNWAGYAYPIYYPRPATWGIGAYYNPVRGMYGRYGYAYGPYRGIAGARAWNPVTGTYGRAGAAWGPRGSAGFVGAYNPRTGAGGFLAGGRNVYGAWKSAGVKRGSEWARVTARDNAAGGSSLRWNSSNGGGFIREGRRGDIYAGRDGNVYRNTGDGWQRFEGGWQDVSGPSQENSCSVAKGARVFHPKHASGSRSGAVAGARWACRSGCGRGGRCGARPAPERRRQVRGNADRAVVQDGHSSVRQRSNVKPRRNVRLSSNVVRPRIVQQRSNDLRHAERRATRQRPAQVERPAAQLQRPASSFPRCHARRPGAASRQSARDGKPTVQPTSRAVFPLPHPSAGHGAWVREAVQRRRARRRFPEAAVEVAAARNIGVGNRVLRCGGPPRTSANRVASCTYHASPMTRCPRLSCFASFSVWEVLRCGNRPSAF